VVRLFLSIGWFVFIEFRLEPFIYSYANLETGSVGFDSFTAACLSPERAEIIARCCHTLILHLTVAQAGSDIAVVLSTCMNLKNLILVTRRRPHSLDPFERHTPRSLKRLVIDWTNRPSIFDLSAVVSRTMLTNLTHLSIKVNRRSSRDNFDRIPSRSWTPLHWSSLQYLSFEILGSIRTGLIPVMSAILDHSPPSLKALIFVIWFNWRHVRSDLDAIERWFAQNQSTTESGADPALKSNLASVTILAAVTMPGSDESPVEHPLWDRAFMITCPEDHEYYDDVCEELLQENKLTLWEAAELALAERQTRRRLEIET
jgi:hypothetical protein